MNKDWDEDIIEELDEDIVYEEYEFTQEVESDELDEEWNENSDIFEQLENGRLTPFTNLWVTILMEVTILVLIVLLVSGIRFWVNNPNKLAKDFVQKKVTRDWNDVYAMLYFEKGEELLSKKLFVTTQSLNANNKEIIHCKIKNVKEISKKPLKYQIDYMKNDESGTEEIEMKKIKGKWKVLGDSLFVEQNISILVPKDATVYFDEFELDRSYIQEKEDKKDLYILPSSFDGMHLIRVEKKNMETVERLANPTAEEAVKVSMKFSDEFLKHVGTKAQTVIKEEYEKVDTGRTKLISLTLDPNTIHVKQKGKEPKKIEVCINSDYEYKYKPSQYYRRVRTRTGTVENKVIYIYDGNELKIEKVELQKRFLRRGRY